ncbi:alpha-aspartyl dipeptidase. Serine peptidase. MEROPS family S51 [Kushneria avicenniae]|uniref:Alpha-aspartyl dipeptidase. Serine peptidase. MEROPS family S51 n=1 Tax=Kushneria avicenniae TaxID=402385 RepID=A0A1I1MSY2_9GAMM|nr:dipeptidase PepE [Kushneria avicenniae]SFC88265.1 alpha-aspartyl dipeptidase. Serine peptidase. MEROPS family S51 [Kushneria avicenniae]
MSRLLLLSSAMAGDGGYLAYARPLIKDFLSAHPVRIRQALFVPHASVSRSFDTYLVNVRAALDLKEISLESLHDSDDPEGAIRSAEALMVGGGNTFALVSRLYEKGLIDVIRERVRDGMAYIGWSAGANIAAPTLCTTNDMPIVEPPSFRTFDLVPFQINPHFIAAKSAGHHGESREERLSEYLALNPDSRVVALPEGTALRREGDRLELLGEQDAWLLAAQSTQALSAGQPCNGLLGSNDTGYDPKAP